MSNRLSLREKGLRASLIIALALVAVGLLPASASAFTGKSNNPARYVGPANLSAVKDFAINMKEGSTARDAAIVARYFHRFGLQVTIAPDNQILFAHGTYGQAAAAAHTSYARVEWRGERFIEITRPESYPPEVTARILAAPVSDGPAMRPQYVTAPQFGIFVTPFAGYSPANIGTYYDIAPIYTAGYKGTGRTVAIAACGYVLPADISKFESYFGIPTNTPTYILVGSPHYTVNADEPVLDIEREIGTANAVKVYVYRAAEDLAPVQCSIGAFATVYAKIATDASTLHFDSVNISYGLGEDDYFFGTCVPTSCLSIQIASNSDLSSMVSKGATPFCASGDIGAWGDVSDGALDVLFPASSIYCVAVGGTSAASHGTASPTTRLIETAWASIGASGGGASQDYSIPSWQVGFGGASTTHRNVPDVSLDGDPFTGYQTWITDTSICGTLHPQCDASFGGTSASTPTWAAFLALVDQKRAALLKAKLASVALHLYGAHAMAGTYVDITAGCNGYFCAKPGYDNVTGLGVFDAAHLWTYLTGLP